MKNRKRPPDRSPVRGRTAIRLRQIYRIYPNRTYPTDKASRIPARTAERRPVPCGRADRMSTQRFGRGGRCPNRSRTAARRDKAQPRPPVGAAAPSPFPVSAPATSRTPQKSPPRPPNLRSPKAVSPTRRTISVTKPLSGSAHFSGCRRQEQPGMPNLRFPDCFPQHVTQTTDRQKSQTSFSAFTTTCFPRIIILNFI